MEDNIVVEVELDSADGKFDNKEMIPLLYFVGEMIEAVVPIDEKIKLVGSQDRSALTIGVEFGNPEDSCKLFIGPKFRTVNAILELIRFQQFLPNDRYIEFRMKRADGSTQKISNRRVFGRPRTEVEKLLDSVSNCRTDLDPNKQIETLKGLIQQAQESIVMLGSQ